MTRELSLSVRRVATVGVVLAWVLLVPFAAITYYRTFQIRAHAQQWAELAQASIWLGTGVSCGGADSAGIAQEDLRRWSTAVEKLRKGSQWFSNPTLVQKLAALEVELAAVLAQPQTGYVTWARAHCHDLGQLSALALDQSVRLGTDPASKSYRHEDLLLRDITTYLLLWLIAGTFVLIWTRRHVVRPVVQLGHVIRRIADGDITADVPITTDGAVSDVAMAVRELVDRFEERDLLKTHKVVEQRDLVRRLIEVLDEPVLVIGLDYKIDYANEAAAKAFDEKIAFLEGTELRHLPGGLQVIDTVADVIGQGDTHCDRVLMPSPSRQEKHVATCVIVRDRAGNPSRVIMLFKAAEGGWWKKLWTTGKEETRETA